MNVKGAYTLKSTFDFSRTIDEKRYWSWQTNADAGYHHSIDHAMLTGMTASEENIVNTLTLHDGAYIQYNKGTLNIRATGDIRWRHSEGKMRDFKTLNATDFQYGLAARYTLPRLNTTLSADGNMYSRRGYGSSELNTNDFVLNASVSQPFLKGKLIARIEAFDLLHQLSNRTRTPKRNEYGYGITICIGIVSALVQRRKADQQRKHRHCVEYHPVRAEHHHHRLAGVPQQNHPLLDPHRVVL